MINHPAIGVSPIYGTPMTTQNTSKHHGQGTSLEDLHIAVRREPQRVPEAHRWLHAQLASPKEHSCVGANNSKHYDGLWHLKQIRLWDL